MCIYLTSHSHQYVGLHVSIGLSQLYNCTVSIVCFWKVSKVYDTARFFIIVWFCLSISFSFPFWPSFRVFLRFLSFDTCYKEKAVRTWHAWFPFHMGEKKKKSIPQTSCGNFFFAIQYRSSLPILTSKSIRKLNNPQQVGRARTSGKRPPCDISKRQAGSVHSELIYPSLGKQYLKLVKARTLSKTIHMY